MASPHDLLHRLLEYIAEQAKDIDPRSYRLSATKDYLLRRESVAGLPGVEFDIKVEGDHIWMRVQRLMATKPPTLPERTRGLFRVSDDPNGPSPTLDEQAFLYTLQKETEGKTDAESAALETRMRAYLSSALEVYQGQWVSWAEGERLRRKTINLYGDLFALKHQLEAEETAKPQEFIWGIGIATWNLSFEEASIAFEYPLLTQAIEISLDEKTMVLEIRPRATETRTELDAFAACQIAGIADIERAVREQLARHKDRPVTPFDPSSYTDVLKLVATNLDSRGSYRKVIAKEESVPPPGAHLIVTDAWVLLVRPRSKNYLIEDLRRLQAKLKAGCDIPPGPGSLVTPPSDEPVEYGAVRFRGISSRGHSAGSKSLQELYFPLPYNDEQVTIVERLEHAPGVSVQGPPGTGKTHTIANIICHYLATGRRVLVTSRGEPALQVLQSKIPAEVRPLTVALLTSDREGVRQFQASIESIQHRVSQLNPQETRRSIDTIMAAIDRAHSELTTIDKLIDKIAIAQLSEVEIDGVPMRAQKLAELVVSGKEQHGWFDDDVSLEGKHAPPLSDEEVEKLREARRKLGQDIVYAHFCIPSADELPSTKAISELHQILSRMRVIEREVARGEVLSLKATTFEILQVARELLGNIDEAKCILQELETLGSDWPLQLRAKCRLQSFATERMALEALFPDLEKLTRARAEYLKRPVKFPEAGLTLQKTKEAVARAAETGKPFGLLSFGNGEAKEHIDAVRIAGRRPKSAEDWSHVHRYVQLNEEVLSFVVRWNQLSADFSLPSLSGGVSALRAVEQLATVARKSHRLATHYDNLIAAKAAAVFDKVPVQLLTGKAEDLDKVRESLERHLTMAELSQAATELSYLQEKLAGKSGPVSEALRTFIAKELGNPSVPQELVTARYAEIIAELRRIASLATEISILKDYSKRLEEAGAIKFAARVRTKPVEASGEDRICPVNWRQAWNWARIRSYLDKIESRDELLSLSARRRDLEGGIGRLYRDMVAKAAWLATKGNATPKVLQALAGYATAIRRIGQGTGPNATRYRRDARDAMLHAAGAVPCWIMSHARISESMPADIGAFDLVIVDEASQSDLWALPAILRGKKILVVGDDKQVSPDAGFISSIRIQELRDRFLTDQPYGAEMTPEKSLYDLAARVFAAYQVMLREHFRCVPPIISYSNRVFYKGAIHPLRIPKPSERIEPPLVDIYIPGGIRNKRDCNELEAEAIAQEIVAILSDERFTGRTIGVASLLGMEQAKYIDTLVRRRCDAGELIRRNFVCGDARTFQGSERDIIFLSLVVDPTNCKAVSGNLFEQRFNVAASRARDRMYLVRSVESSDLSEKDLRMTLLSHFEKPLVADNEEADVLIDRCESGFERQVFTELTSRGYRVMPQVRTGAYRIDMVVEGANDTRLAIECDGDEYHGPDQWPHDMSRQRVLERAGWTFWRCFASTWHLHKNEVLEDLLGRLTAMGIEPVGAVERIPMLVEKRVWQKPESPEGLTDEVQRILEEAAASFEQRAE